MAGEARPFTMGRFRIVIRAEVVAVLHELARATKRRDLQAMFVQFKSTVDLGSQQAADVRAVGVQPVLVQLAADGRPTNVVVLLDTDDIESGFCEESSGRQAIVSGTNDDRIISFHAASLLICWVGRVSRLKAIVQKIE